MLALMPVPAVAQGEAIRACFRTDSVWPEPRAMAVAPRCLRIWIDSLASREVNTWTRAQSLLVVIGGRPAVEALRTAYERTGDAKRGAAAATAMATTGSKDDIAFLRKLIEPPETPGQWPARQAAAITLGFLHEVGARDALVAMLARQETGTATHTAAQAAIEMLDRQPCADSVRANLGRELVRIAMACRPTFLSNRVSYPDRWTGDVWFFSNDTWMTRSRVAADSSIALALSTEVIILPSGTEAFVRIAAHCGFTCGEGWTYRLRRTGNVWRVIGGQMNWVS
jgi:hypothetical protein